MAPKRSAPPPPPPPVASSEETDSGSGSEESEEEEEEEEEVAHSPPPAAPKTTAPPSQKGQESEDSGEEEEEDEDEEEEEEEEDEEKANHVAPPTIKNSSPPPPNREESETSGDEEEETDDEAPQPKSAPNQEAEGKGSKPSSGEDKKPGAYFQRTWSTDDEVRILEALAAHRREHGTLPQADALAAALAAALAGRLDNSGFSPAMLQSKVKSLKRRYTVANQRGERPSKEHDRRLFDLSKSVWGPVIVAADGGTRREFGEMCERYPFLAEEVKTLQKAHPGLFKREFSMIDDDKARTLDVKIKKQRLHQLKLLQRRHDLTKEVTKTLIDLVQ